MNGPDIVTTLPDLESASLDQVIEGLDAYKGAIDMILKQVERPRFNLGSTSAPGRAD